MHQMTSSDVLDTCFMVQLTQASDILLADLDALLAALETRARAQDDPDRRAQWHSRRAGHLWPEARRLRAEFARNRARLAAARAEIATCAISGAVGTFANIDPRVEAHVAAKLGLAVEPVSTQIIRRPARHVLRHFGGDRQLD